MTTPTPLRMIVEDVLREAGLRVAGRRSDTPPMVVVRYGGLAEDASLRRHAVEVWCCVTADIADPQLLTQQAWDALAASGMVMPVDISTALGVVPPGSQTAYDAGIIRAEALQLSV